jgi:hypothetical protein
VKLRSISQLRFGALNRFSFGRAAAVLFAGLAVGGCVERKLTLTSEPSGALVYMNEKEVGRTPIQTDFLWYGKYDVQVRKEGFETLDKPQTLRAPWWQIPPIDLFAELMPWHPTDRQALHFRLKERPTTEPSPDELVTAATALRPLLEGTRVPSTQPAATQPTTGGPGQIVTTPTVQPASRP